MNRDELIMLVRLAGHVGIQMDLRTADLLTDLSSLIAEKGDMLTLKDISKVESRVEAEYPMLSEPSNPVKK